MLLPNKTGLSIDLIYIPISRQSGLIEFFLMNPVCKLKTKDEIYIQTTTGGLRTPTRHDWT